MSVKFAVNGLKETLDAFKEFQEQYGSSYPFILPPTWNSFCALLGIVKDFRNRKNIEYLFEILVF